MRQMQVLDYPALRLEDRLRAARLGLTQRDVATSALISLASSALVSPSYFLNPNGVNYVVSVQTPIERMATVDDLMSTPITPVVSSLLVAGVSQDPREVPQAPVVTLGNLASIKPDASYQSVSHYTVQRVIDVAANVDGRDLGSTVRDIQAKLQRITSAEDFPKTAKITVRGQYEVMQASFESLFLGLVLAVILVYALLVVLFQSWVDPFIIMMAVPGALIGILWMLAVTGTTLNVMSLMGAIMAVGIGVSNSILVVSFANDLRVAHPDMSVVQAAIEAGRTRLRPVLMTAGDDRRHVADGTGAGRSGRAERSARPRRHRRAGGGDHLHPVRGAGGLHAAAQRDADAAHAGHAVRGEAREGAERLNSVLLHLHVLGLLALAIGSGA
jgi:multidrug efflux pump subunit AcrB